MMPSGDSGKPLSDVAERAVKGVLEFSKEQLAVLIKKLQNRELAFIEDEETIEIVKTRREKPEWKLCRKYVKDPGLKLQIEMAFP